MPALPWLVVSAATLIVSALCFRANQRNGGTIDDCLERGMTVPKESSNPRKHRRLVPFDHEKQRLHGERSTRSPQGRPYADFHRRCKTKISGRKNLVKLPSAKNRIGLRV